MLLTSQRMTKAVSFLIVSFFLCFQLAAASHNHTGLDAAPEAEICAACVLSSQDEFEVEIDIDPVLPAAFIIPDTMLLTPRRVSEPSYSSVYDSLNAPEPPHVRPSAPRAPPV